MKKPLKLATALMLAQALPAIATAEEAWYPYPAKEVTPAFSADGEVQDVTYTPLEGAAQPIQRGEREIGWWPVHGVEGAGGRFGDLFAGECEVFHWHGEVCGLPEGARRLAFSRYCANQAFAIGERVLALEPGHKLTDQVRQICEDVGAELSHDYEGTSLDTLRQMVATGIGISLMPALYVKSEVAPNELVVARPFRGTPPARTIGMVWRRGAVRASEYELLAGLMGRALHKSAPEITVLA